MLGKEKDKKVLFVQPQNKAEQEAWLEKLISDISSLGKNEFADLLVTEIEYLLNLIIPELEKEAIIIEIEAPVIIAGDTHG